nr:MAG: hypothetical protein [Caudoviricetes sp.]
MKVKTSELSGIALDYAVAVCEGGSDFCFDGITWGFNFSGNVKVLAKGWAQSLSYCPSSDWYTGGPIIESNKIDTFWDSGNECWDASMDKGMFVESGPTPLIVAMRCFVASKFGDEIDVPEELLLGWKQYDIDNLKRENKKLKKELELLKND